MIKYPEKLKNGDCIGIVALSDGANLEKIDLAEDNLKKFGYDIKETKNTRNSHKLVSCDGKTRAHEFMELFKDKKVKHIISARGGEFLMEMIPYLDEYEEEIKNLKDIKFVQGYSDTSLLLFYLTTKYNISTLHAENLSEYAMNLSNYHASLKNTLDFLVKKSKIFIQENFDKYEEEEYKEGNFKGYNLTKKVNYKMINNKKNKACFEGRIIGGCIDVISILIGTKYDFLKKFSNQFKEGIIWYIDNCELTPMEFYRKLWLMRNVGWFDNVKGVLVGRTFVKDTQYFTKVDALKKAFAGLDIDIIYDVDIGHVPPQLTIINGSYAKVEYDNHKFKITQSLI